MARFTIEECDRCRTRWERTRQERSFLHKVEIKATVKVGLPRESEKELCETCSNALWREWTNFMNAPREAEAEHENMIHILGAAGE